MKKKKTIPKKIKLVTEGGFYKIIPMTKGFVAQINFISRRPLTVLSALTGFQEIPSAYKITFYFTGKVERGYAIYKQSDIVSVGEMDFK